MAQLLPPIPKEPIEPNSHVWREWFNSIRNVIVNTAQGVIAWASLNFAGSNITDIATRNHNSLQTIQGGTANQYYHLTATQLTNLGTVTTISVATSNGFAGTVATATTTPVITLSTSITGLLKGNGTAISAATSGTDYAPATSGASILYGNGSGGFSNVTIGSGVSFTTGTLSATGSGGTITSVTGTAGRVSSTGGTTPVIDLVSGIASAGTTGSVSLIPVVTIDTYGRVTSITTAANPQGTVTSVAALTLGTTGTDLSSTVANGTTTPVITLQVPTASASNRGALSAADWTTFNNKVTSVSGTAGRTTSTGGATPVIDLVSGIATAGTTGSASLIPVVTIDTYGRVTTITTAANPQGTVTSVTGTAPVVSSGGATPAISMAAATTSVNGYLTSTDWTTFNGKLSYTGATGDVDLNAKNLTNVSTFSAATVKATTAAGYISSDGSTGYTGTVTTSSLVGMTITIKDGLITGFAQRVCYQ